jgi:peptidoglycan/xylan/chitin deacetylase (PgdA/CDA1 family)
MLKRARVFLLFAALILAATQAIGSWSFPPRVLLYHRVGDDRYPSTNVTTAAFRAQMQWLREHGYTVVPTRELERYLTEGIEPPDRAVAIHFDDGYRSVYDNAFPVLREFGYPFTVFLPTRAIERGFGDYFRWAEAAEMAEHGASYGSHGANHLRLGAADPGEGQVEYRQKIAAEFASGAEALQHRGYEARWVAYPYGEYNTQVLEAARATGYRLGFSQDPGAIGPKTDPTQIPRFAVVGSVADMTTFRERMGYGALAILSPEPDPGPIPSEAPKRYAAQVVDPARYLPGVVNLFVSELGRLEVRFDPQTGLVEASSQAILTRRLNRVLISLKERATGRYALVSWVLINPRGK